MEISLGKNKQMRSSALFFHILVVIVHLGFDFYQHVSAKMEDVSSSLPHQDGTKGGSGMEDDKMRLLCPF